MTVEVEANPLVVSGSARRGRRQRAGPRALGVRRAVGSRAAALGRALGPRRAGRWRRRSVLSTDCLALLAPGSRGETRYARFASSARTIAASQRDEARCARRPRGCAARRRRHRPARRGPSARPSAAARAPTARRTPSARGPARCRLPRARRMRCPHRSRGSPSRAPQRFRQRCGPPAAGAPVRSREAQQCRPAREARFVPLTRRDCSSGASAARVASFAAGPALRASQGTPAKRGQAPARRRRAGHAFARASISCARYRKSRNARWGN